MLFRSSLARSLARSIARSVSLSLSVSVSLSFRLSLSICVSVSLSLCLSPPRSQFQSVPVPRFQFVTGSRSTKIFESWTCRFPIRSGPTVLDCMRFPVPIRKRMRFLYGTVPPVQSMGSGPVQFWHIPAIYNIFPIL